MKAQEKIQPGSNVNVTQDSFLYWLMQTATKSDVAELRGEVKADMNRLDSRIDRLDAKIDIVAKNLDAKIDTVRTELKGDIASLRKSNHAFFFWVIGLMFGGFGTLGGLMLKLLSR